MTIQNITLPLPESIYIRLQQTAQATRQSLTDVLIHAVKIGSPPSWEDVPAEFQADLAALDRLHEQRLWEIARSHQTEADMQAYDILLAKNTAGTITEAEHNELAHLRKEADRLMLQKAHAADLLRWRGQIVPPANQL